MRIRRLAMPAPALFIGLQIGHLPAPLADLGDRRLGQGVGELLPGEAMQRVGLPVHIEGELHQRAKSLFAIAQRLDDLRGDLSRLLHGRPWRSKSKDPIDTFLATWAAPSSVPTRQWLQRL